MAEMQKDEYKFPDEMEDGLDVDLEPKAKETAPEPEERASKFDIEIEDDTPTEDRNKQPMPKEIVEDIEKDELDRYSDEAKVRLKQLRKVYHDERRAKESADRERAEAVDATTRLLAENQRMKQMINNGQKEYLTVTQQSADLQLEVAKKAYKEAYDSGDSDRVLEAQQAITNASIQLDKVKSFRVPPLQEEEYAVQRQEQVQDSRPDTKAMAWQERNSWFGQDEEMTASALGLHEKLKKQGVVVGSEEYYTTLDKTIRRRFPENFGSQEGEEAKPREDAPKAKPSTVVAPATRSTAPKQVRLKTSQVQLAKKLGLTNEQYARELLKMEA
jgi:hypothetical protein